MIRKQAKTFVLEMQAHLPDLFKFAAILPMEVPDWLELTIPNTGSRDGPTHGRPPGCDPLDGWAIPRYTESPVLYAHN